LKSWDQNVYKTIENYQRKNIEYIKKKLKLLDQIEKTRKNNNINWMNIVRQSIKSSPRETLKILNSINEEDNKISKLFKKLNEK